LDSILDTLAQPIHDELAKRWTGDLDSLQAVCKYALIPAGKLFRPMLLLESALAVGGEIEQVLPAAVGSEYGHTASLIHDDIIDNDDLRRERVTVFRKFGTDNAIVAGDALIFGLFLCLAECRKTGVPPDRIVAALEIAATSGIDMCRGQSLESEITANSLRDLNLYLEMIALKSAALFSAACQCGAVLGGGSDIAVQALGDYGKQLGLAFQIIDDLFAFTRDSATIGKPTTSDIRNRRLTLPILFAYQSSDPADIHELDRAFCDTDEGSYGAHADAGDGADADAAALAAVTATLERTGALDRSFRAAEKHAAAARDVLTVLPETPSRERLAWFADRAVGRVS
jgi:geranylgeranyl diphosphate synthase type I